LQGSEDRLRSCSTYSLEGSESRGLLRGKKLSDELLEEWQKAPPQKLNPGIHPRRAWYRKDMIKVMVKRMAMKSIERVVQPEANGVSERLW